MPFDQTVPQHYTVDFAEDQLFKRDRVHKVISQHCQLHTGCTGSRKTLNVDDYTEGREITGQRFPKLNVQEPLGDIRSVTPREFDHTAGRDRKDGRKLYPLIVGNGKHAVSHSRFYHRTCDKVFREGITGDNYTGENGTTVSNIPAGNQIAVDFVQTGSTTASNLTVGKLHEVNHLARQQELIGEDSMHPGSKLHGAINSAMLKSLRWSVYNDAKADRDAFDALASGKSNEFQDIIWHRTEDIPETTTSNVYNAFFWVPELVALCVWEDFEYRAWEESTLSFAPLTWSMFSLGATRIQDEGVFLVACNVTL